MKTAQMVLSVLSIDFFDGAVLLTTSKRERETVQIKVIKLIQRS